MGKPKNRTTAPPLKGDTVRKLDRASMAELPICKCDVCEARRKNPKAFARPGYTGTCGVCGHRFWTPGSVGDCPRCQKKVRLTLTPDESEQTLRALNKIGMLAKPPYFRPKVLMDAAIKITDAMTAAGIDHKESSKDTPVVCEKCGRLKNVTALYYTSDELCLCKEN